MGTASSWLNLIDTAIYYFFELVKFVNDQISRSLVPILAPYIGLTLARITVYLILMLGLIYIAGKYLDGLAKYITLMIVFFLLITYTVT